MIYTQHERFTLHQGDNRDVLKDFADNSIDSIVTDPPYELGFMGKSWDASGIAFNVEVWQECLRVLKPGGHLLAFSGSRTYHRMAVAIEDAGFEIRDQIMWIYGSGFPKSHNIAKQLDKLAGVKGEIIGQKTGKGYSSQQEKNLAHGFREYKEGLPYEHADLNEYALASEEAKQWQGWGTALKPAHEPIVLARKRLIGTVAANVLTYGTGGLNIDGARIEGKLEGDPNRFAKTDGGWAIAELHEQPVVRSEGRWPANVIHDGSDEVVELFPTSTSRQNQKSDERTVFNAGISLQLGAAGIHNPENSYTDSGSAARFFYCAKANKRDRNEGLDGFEEKRTGAMQATEDGSMLTGSGNPRTTTRANHHPTVKPTDLMRYLCRLVTPPNGIVLDPFTGSGSTGKAAIYEGFNFIGIEMTEEYLPIAKARIEFALNE